MENLNTSAFVNDESIYDKKTKAVPIPKKEQGIDLDNTLLSNIVDGCINSIVDMSALNGLNNTAQSRNDMYNIFDMMCQDGSISAVVETYAEDATEQNDSGSIVWVESDEPEVLKLVEYYLDTLNIDKHIFKWVYSLCKYGDVYLRLYRESDFNDSIFNNKKKLDEDVKIRAYKSDDNYAHYVEMVANPAEMFELTKFGKTVGYIKASVQSTLDKKDSLSFAQYQYNVKREDIEVYQATEFVHAALEDNVDRSEEVINIFLNSSDYETNTNANTYKVRKGQSLIADAFKVWRELSLLENSVLLYRVTKSSRVRLVNVEVGDMPKENVAKTLMGVKRMIEQKAAINSGVSMNEYNAAGPIENTVYIPTHGGIGNITTSEIGGDVDVKSLADLDYYINKLYGQLRVPKQYFSNTDDSTGFNGGTSLSIISSRYAKMIKRIQNTIIQMLTDMINLMLLDKGLPNYINKFTLHMMPPTTQEEIDRREAKSSEVQLCSDIMNMLDGIEDQSTKLKILKALLSGVVTDSTVIQEISTYIDTLDEANVQPEEDDESEDNISLDIERPSSAPSIEAPSMPSFSDEDETITPSEPSEAPEETGGNVLPSGADLGIDLTDSNL